MLLYRNYDSFYTKVIVQGNYDSFSTKFIVQGQNIICQGQSNDLLYHSQEITNGQLGTSP